MRRLRALAPLALALLAACPDAASAPCGDGFCRPGLVCSATLECVPAGAYCGDHHVDPGETCDDGADNDDTRPDACRSDCQPHRCGDGVLDSDEVPLCLRAGPADVLHLALDAPSASGRLLVHDAALPRSRHTFATVDGGAQVALFTFDPAAAAGAPPARALVDVGLPASGGSFWDPGAGADLIVFAPDGQAARLAFVDGFWQHTQDVHFGLADLVAVQPLGSALVVASSTRVELGTLVDTMATEVSTWTPAVGFEVEGGSVRALRVGSLAGTTTVVALVETPGGRELRAYAVDRFAGTATLAATAPLAPEDVLLELQVGVSGSSGAGEVLLAFSDRLELRDAALTTLRSDVLPARLAWAHAARAAWNDDDVLVGGGAAGTLVARLVPDAAATPPVVPTIQPLDADAALAASTSDGTLVDIDRDGWPDLLRRRPGAIDVQRAGDGPWSSPVRQDGSARPLAIGDLDGDGVPELVGYDADGGELHRQAARPGRGLAPPDAHRLMSDTANVVRALPCDVDGDGAAELAVQLDDSEVTSLAVLRLRPPASDDDDAVDVLWSQDSATSGQLAAADLDADGACDVLFVDDGGRALLLPGRPGAGVGAPVDLGHIEGLASGVLDARAEAAPGGDALVVLSTDDVVTWARGDALTGAWAHRSFLHVTSALPGLFTEDALPDVLAVADSGAYLWNERPDDPGATLDGPAELALDGRLSPGDLNGDGLTDLVVNTEDDVHVLLARDHRAPPAQRFAAAVPYRPELGLLADLDGDGAADWVSVGQRFLRVRYGQKGVAAQTRAATSSPSTR